MNNDILKRLFGLYIEGKKYVEKLVPAMDYFAKGEGAVFEVDTLGYGTTITKLAYRNNVNSFDNCSGLKYIYDDLVKFKESWLKQTYDVINGLPFFSYRIRFEESSDIKYDGSMEYINILFTDDMKEAINEASDLCYKVRELAVLINDYEKTLPQPTVGNMDPSNSKKKDESPVVFTFEYDPMKSVATVNGFVVHKCNLDSALDRALTEAVKKPQTAIKMKSTNTAALVHQFKMPKQLRELMFNCGKSVLMLKPTITEADLKKRGLDANLLLKELEDIAGKNA